MRPLGERLRAWQEVSGREIAVHSFTVGEQYHRLLTLIREFRPDAIVHFAEQRAAPYSMKSSWHKRYTVHNNLMATHDTCAAVVESGVNVHLVHLGTMGVYGYGTAGMRIPDGYLPIKVATSDGELLSQVISWLVGHIGLHFQQQRFLG